MRSSILRSLLVVPLLAVSACSPSEPTAEVSTPAPTASEPAEDVEATIIALEEQWVAAIVDGDTATLDRLLADDFVGTSPTAHFFYKSMAIDDLDSGTYVVSAMDMDEVSANVYGDTAVAYTSQEETSTYAGEDTSGHYHYTNVWLRRNGQWQVVASHGSRYDEPH